MTELNDFAIIAIHTDPDDAVREVGALHKVYDVTKAHWDLEVTAGAPFIIINYHYWWWW